MGVYTGLNKLHTEIKRLLTVRGVNFWYYLWVKVTKIINNSAIFKMQQSVLQQDYSELCKISDNRGLGSTPNVHLNPLPLVLYIMVHAYDCCLLLPSLLLRSEHSAELILSSNSGLRQFHQLWFPTTPMFHQRYEATEREKSQSPKKLSFVGLDQEHGTRCISISD